MLDNNRLDVPVCSGSILSIFKMWYFTCAALLDLGRCQTNSGNDCAIAKAEFQKNSNSCKNNLDLDFLFVWFLLWNLISNAVEEIVCS